MFGPKIDHCSITEIDQCSFGLLYVLNRTAAILFNHKTVYLVARPPGPPYLAAIHYTSCVPGPSTDLIRKLMAIFRCNQGQKKSPDVAAIIAYVRLVREQKYV